MIAFEHGALQHRGEPLLAGILAHGILEVSDAQVITFLAHAERLTIEEWLEILTSARELRAQRLPAVRRLRDTIGLTEPSVIGLMANERIAAIALTLEQELHEQGGEAAGVVLSRLLSSLSSRQLHTESNAGTNWDLRTWRNSAPPSSLSSYSRHSADGAS
jgi:hypothetical protein